MAVLFRLGTVIAGSKFDYRMRLKQKLDGEMGISGFSQRTMSFDGSDLILCGHQDDSYFANVGIDDALAFTLRRLNAGDIVFDVGANIGLTASAFASKGATVHCFEPDSSVYECLTATIKANDIGDFVSAHNLALGTESGILTLFSNPTSASASHLVTDETLGQRDGAQVQVTTVDEFATTHDLPRLDLLKIDVEGFEIDVLRGSTKTISKMRPAALIEFNAFTMIGFRDVNPRDLLREIRLLWPHVYRIKGNQAVELANDADELGFLHDLLLSNGCVDDLYASFEYI